MSDHIPIGTMIASLRVKHDISQKEFAILINKNGSYLSQIENNARKPGKKLLLEIITKLNISLAEFLFLLIKDITPDQEILFYKNKQFFNLILNPLIEKLKHD